MGDKSPNPASAPTGAVFLSYASQDAEAAQKICDALRAAGVEVWFDQSELRGGEAWDHAIRRQIRDCALFVPIISQNTQARTEGYFRLEWRLAEQRSHLMARSRAFLVPVCVDDTPDADAEVPESFLAVQWTRVPAGDEPHAFAEHVTHLLSADRKPNHIPEIRSHAPLATSAPSETLPHGPTQAESIAVLPFVDMSRQKDQEYFADGITEELIDALVNVPSLKVIGRTSSFQFKGRNQDLRSIGTTLGAAYIVEGSVRCAGQRIRITAQLIDAGSGTHLWAESYDREFGDVLVLQDQIATSVARALQVAVSSNQVRPRRELLSAEAYTLYLHGLSAYDRKNEDSLLQAQTDFDQALVLDPSFLRAAEALALVHIAQAFYQNVAPDKAWQQAKAVAERCLHLDSNSAIAHAVLGLVLGSFEFAWDAAETELRKAVTLNPRNPVPLEFSASIAHYRAQGGLAKRHIGASLALDPLNPYAHTTLAQILLGMGDFAGAIRAYRKGLVISASAEGNHYHIGHLLLSRGDLEAARVEFEAESAIDAKCAGIAMLNFALGRTADADSALNSLILNWGYRFPFGIAQVCAHRGKSEAAFEWLETACRLRDPDLLSYMATDAFIAPLRTDPRYGALRRRMNLPL